MSLIYDIYDEDRKKLRKKIWKQNRMIKELLSLCRESDQWWLMTEARKVVVKYGYKE